VDAVVINRDPMVGGLTIVQAKRYTNVIGVSHIRELVGAMDEKRAGRGILVTTSWFASGCKIKARDNGRIQLIEGSELVHLVKRTFAQGRLGRAAGCSVSCAASIGCSGSSAGSDACKRRRSRGPASDASIEPALEPAKLFECISKGGCDVGGSICCQPLCWIRRAPAAAFRRDRLRFRAVWAWLCEVLRPAASFPATPSPRSRTSFMITSGLASTK
jgi:hypothetical protein